VCSACPFVSEVFVVARLSVPASVWFSLAARAGAVDWSVRVSARSFSGWVVESVFPSYSAACEFAQASSGVVGVGVCVRRWVPVSVGWVTWSGCWACSVPCAVPGRVLSLGWASRGSRAVVSA
jgi:hypothetical protein